MTGEDAAADGNGTAGKAIPPALDTSVAHQARMYDYLVGGKDNYAADRQAVRQLLRAAPEARDSARANRAFLQRAVRFLAGEAGIEQIIDIGTGPADRGQRSRGRAPHRTRRAGGLRRQRTIPSSWARAAPCCQTSKTRSRSGPTFDKSLEASVHDLIVTPFLDEHLVLCPGSPGALRLPRGRYRELAEMSESGSSCPKWLADAVRRYWQRDVARRSLSDAAVIRQPSPYGYVRATYELNLGCNYEHALDLHLR